MHLHNHKPIKRFLFFIPLLLLLLIPNSAFAQSDAEGLPDPNFCFAASDGHIDANGTQRNDSWAQDTLAFLNRMTGDTSPVGGAVANISNTANGAQVMNIEAIAFAPAGTTLYAADAAQLGTLDLATGDFTPLPNTFGSGVGYRNGNCNDSRVFDDVDGLSFDVTGSILYGSDRTSGPDILFAIDPETGLLIPDAFDHPTCGLVDFVAVEPQIDPGNGDRLADDVDDIAVDPVTGDLYGILNKGGTGGMLGLIDKNSGETTVIGNFIRDGSGVVVQDMEGLSFFNDGVMYGSTGKSFGNSNLLWKVDKTTGVVEQIGQFTNNIVDIEGIDCLSARVMVDIEKHTNGEDADDSPGPIVAQDGAVQWEYFVRNTGAQALINIQVADDKEGPICTIDRLEPGELHICEASSTAQAGAYMNEATVEAQAEVDPTVTVGDSDPSHYFGELPPGLGDYVWHDIDQDGVQDPFEPGVEGVVIQLYNAADDTLVAETTTDANGFYLFDANDGLTTGEFYVVAELPLAFDTFSLVNNHPGNDDTIDSDVGSDPNQPNFGRTTIITLESGETDLNWDVGLIGDGQPASLGNYVWLDRNRNGLQDDGDTGVAGVVVQLLDANGNSLRATTTDENGLYEFTNLAPGDYRVQFDLPAEHFFTEPNQGGDENQDSDANPTTGQTALITLLPNQNDDSWDAGLISENEPTGLGNFVWEDSNGNGIQDEGEPGIEDVVVNLLDAEGNPLQSTATDVDGFYAFNDLAPGDYHVEFILPDGYLFAPTGQGDDGEKDSDANPENGQTGPISLAQGQIDNSWDAGLVRPASLGDLVWLDANGNGIQDEGETGHPDVTVNLLNESREVIATTTTDENGNYQFTDLVPGTYMVHFVAPDGFGLSPRNRGRNDVTDSDPRPRNGRTASIRLSPGEHNPNVDAGLIDRSATPTPPPADTPTPTPEPPTPTPEPATPTPSSEGCTGTPVTVGNDTVYFVEVRYDYPVPGESTWYYCIESGDKPAISHVTYDLHLVDEDGCQTVVDSGTWGPTTDDLNSGAGQPEVGKDKTTGDIFGLKFDEGFDEGEIRQYYFTMDGNYAIGEITIASKGGNGFDTAQVPGPVATCEETGETPTATPEPATETPVPTPEPATETPAPTEETATDTPEPATETPTPTAVVAEETPAPTPTDDLGGTSGQGCLTGTVVDVLGAGLPAWTVYAKPADAEGPILETMTDGTGTFTFNELAAGHWVVWYDLPDGWEAATASEIEVLVNEDESCTAVTFINRQKPSDGEPSATPVVMPGCLVGHQTHTNQPGLSVWNIRIHPVDADEPVYEMLTDTTGLFQFFNLAPGEWVVEQRRIEGDSYATEAIFVITVPAGPSCTELTFGVAPPAPTPIPVPIDPPPPPTTEIGCIVGQTIDDHHFGLAGWTVYARPADAESPIYQVSSGTNGYFTFHGLTPGKWQVWEEDRTGWTPVTAPIFEVDVPADPGCVDVRFKNRQD